MKPITKRFLFWAPRVLCILFAAFISIFALDVFDENRGWRLVLALGMHLIPTALVLVVLALAWKWEWVGGVVCLGLGAFYVYWSWGKFGWMAPVFIAGPLFLVGALFLAGWTYRKEIRGVKGEQAPAVAVQ